VRKARRLADSFQPGDDEAGRMVAAVVTSALAVIAALGAGTPAGWAVAGCVLGGWIVALYWLARIKRKDDELLAAILANRHAPRSTPPDAPVPPAAPPAKS
jgi:hypothetical protein